MKLTEAEHDRIAMAVHEAAHSCVGVLRGGRVTTIELTADGSGSTTFVDLPRSAEAAVAYAGPFAESRLRYGTRKPDHKQLAEVFSRNRHGDGEVLAAHAGPMPRGEVERLIDTCWPAISVLATRLFEGDEIGHRAVCEQLGVGLWDVPLSLGANRIQNGRSPIPCPIFCPT